MPDLAAAISALARQGWAQQGKKLHKQFAFTSFADALAFMQACAPEIARLDHHPEWLNVYNKVTVDLTTHSAGAITAKDVELAGIMDKMAAEFAK
ncbi:MAG TPA: 4a-hydroxytetrahydrobiopterin dehydratase [Alphaproteobacteria bacterium]|nr:4a-hydroxytetrahydrobiopterin dehydratase [Alphaproteobacteria bacterium]